MADLHSDAQDHPSALILLERTLVHRVSNLVNDGWKAPFL